jgi:hypothetical protein
MKKTLALLLLLALPSLAQTPTQRQPFPDDYTPSPCAPDADAICASFDKSRMVDSGKAFRGFELHNDWVDAHWDEMRAAFKPFCAKAGSCFTVQDNTWVYCIDLIKQSFFDTCERFPEGSYDRDQCRQFAMTYWLGLGSKRVLHEQAQTCAKSQPAAAGERTLEAFMIPEKFDINYAGPITIHAYDAETHIPVRANLSVDAGELRSGEGPIARTGYKNKWNPKLKAVPNASGHHDAVAPTLTISAPGYKPLSIPMPVDVPRLVAEITPTALKPGKNTFTVNVRDAATGKPVWARVMAGTMVLGESNQPLELELTQQDKRPEIWVSTLDYRYGDVVVVKGEH